MQNPMMENWIRFTHLEKLYGYLPGMDEDLAARLFGLDLEDYREVKGRFDANAGEAASQLLDDASPQVSVEESARNLEAMRRIARPQTEAGWVWITPPTYDEERASSFQPFQQGQSIFRNEDVVAIGDYFREQKEPVVDIQAVFGTPANPELQGPDGVHPSLAGQKAIAKAFVERLASIDIHPSRRMTTGWPDDRNPDNGNGGASS